MISLVVAFCFHFGPLVRLTIWLRRRIAEVDEFIAKLWQVHLAVKKEGYTQVDRLGSLHQPWHLVLRFVRRI